MHISLWKSNSVTCLIMSSNEWNGGIFFVKYSYKNRFFFKNIKFRLFNKYFLLKQYVFLFYDEKNWVNDSFLQIIKLSSILKL